MGLQQEAFLGVAEITFRDEDSPELWLRWHGGAYIDVMVGAEAVDVINVWDDEEDRSTFESEVSDPSLQGEVRRPFRFVLESFEDLCRRYLSDQIDEFCEDTREV